MSSPQASPQAGATRSTKRKRGLPEQVRMRHSRHFVEELAQRSEPSIGRMLALASIEPDPNQPREAMGELDGLVQSIRDKGVLEPILVRRSQAADGEDEGVVASVVYRIISGERRFRASMEAGLLEIPAIEMEVTEPEAREIALIENLQRKDLTPFEEAEGYRVLAEVHDYTHEQIAAAVGKSRVGITESFALLKMSPKVRDVVQALGIQAKSVLLEVMKIEDEDEMIRLLERVSSLGLNRADLRREVKRTTRAGPSRSKRDRPFRFSFQAPDKRYNLAISFRQETVDHEDLISALENTIAELRRLRDEEDRALEQISDSEVPRP